MMAIWWRTDAIAPIILMPLPDPLNKCIYKSWGAYWVDSSNSTDVSYHAVRAYYDIYSKLRQDHPGPAV